MLITLSSLSVAHAQISVIPAEARAIAKEAYIYSFPMVDCSRILYAYFVDQNKPDLSATPEPSELSFVSPWSALCCDA